MPDLRKLSEEARRGTLFLALELPEEVHSGYSALVNPILDALPALLSVLDAAEKVVEVREIADVMGNGTEIVFCGEQDGEYVGWIERESAAAKGYTVSIAVAATGANLDSLRAALLAAEGETR